MRLGRLLSTNAVIKPPLLRQAEALNNGLLELQGRGEGSVAQQGVDRQEAAGA